MSDLVKRQVEMLRKQCIWQRAKGTKSDNGYPYHKHYPDCDICRSAELIEQLQADKAEAVIYFKGRLEVACDRIKELIGIEKDRNNRIEQLEADLLLLWKLDTYSDDPHEYRELLEKYASLEKDDV